MPLLSHLPLSEKFTIGAKSSRENAELSSRISIKKQLKQSDTNVIEIVGRLIALVAVWQVNAQTTVA